MQTATGATTALGATVRLTEQVFEIQALGQQARAPLDTVNRVHGQLDVARSIREQRSHLFSAVENAMIDDTFNITERTIGQVAELVEPYRGTMNGAEGSLGIRPCLIYALPDTPQIQILMQQLTLAAQSLSMMTMLLFSWTTPGSACPELPAAPRNLPSSYAESSFLTETRTRNLIPIAKKDLIQQQHISLICFPSRLLSP